ncbi:adenylate/guanylate cyclase domain-containing protein [Denitrobaculum tricleocarpae]|uniref:Adenylate/guanylate cyclase domain-containing protein n=1 Tax=Denitrobaculum tricleocarpae TaxID=2591009 RepID=A0A545TAW5_9PROT|nr:adenylate/guanylate cyclase domain-containing protein [Denitrobaculum tricleocarpae]TQV74351.1 adenylate/guanylate cyclase domain-containing protein [Denitrobaculum tricleocarpae]
MSTRIEPIKSLPPQVAAQVAERARNLHAWLVGDARFIDDPDLVVEGFVQRLIDSGLPLDRMSSAIPTLYAVRSGLGRNWNREDGVTTQEFPWDSEEIYQDSPFYKAHQTRAWVSFRLDEIDDSAFGIVSELRSAGFTDYICMPVFFRDGTEGGLTFATRSPAGFSDADMALLHAIEDAMALLLDLNRVWILLRETLRMYVGDEPQARILSGQVRRGDVVHIRSAIVFADMRGFTALSGQMSGEDTVALLNRYFDCVVPPIEETEGDVLKYMGDGVLAIFRAEEDGKSACTKALAAAREILERVEKDRAQADPSARFDIKIALHFGAVAYGNIGSGARLDYTVVGGSVNLASRLADLAGNLDKHILVSSDFAERLPEQAFKPMGEHSLRGVAEPQKVFAPVA